MNIGVYTDPACTQNASFVDWGALKPGENTTKIVYVKNVGTANATLTMATNNWIPNNAHPSISLSWNKEAKPLSPNESTQAVLILTVSRLIDSDITSFSFNILVTGIG